MTKSTRVTNTLVPGFFPGRVQQLRSDKEHKGYKPPLPDSLNLPCSDHPKIPANPVLKLPLACRAANTPPKPLCQSWLRPRGPRGRVLKKFQAEMQLEKGGSIPRAPWQCQQSHQRCHTRCPALGLGTGMLTRGLKLPSSVSHMDPAARAREKHPRAGFGCRSLRAAGQEEGLAPSTRSFSHHGGDGIVQIGF